MLKNTHFHTCIEAICTLGCDSVRKVIADIESGRLTATDYQLDESEVPELLQELKSVMAVYDARQPTNSDETSLPRAASRAHSS